MRSVVLLVLAALPVVALAALIVLIAAGLTGLALALVITLVVAALSPVVVAAFNRCRPRGLLAFVVCLPVFVVPFWLGLIRGVFIHRRAFLRARKEEFA